ncbi:HRDC domain-containing protein [Chryseobacterium gwangjuense]|uniref:HRDC domain-containing protein n=1 Tax=Chryseobacterium gwangjuense TaxID=1069980 RepID=UPI001E32011E|nr:HRDC domain-containing protein [Chryseobacterium gwangjuense]MCE3074217.1 HRDC domain-containing protein [Chryseobacterium gwangjuense]
MKIKVLKVRIAEEFLRIDQKKIDQFLNDHQILNVETAFVHDGNFWSVIFYYAEIENPINSVKDSKSVKYSAEDEILNTDDIKILDALKLWRSEKAKENNLPSYFIATNKELTSVAKYKPAKKEELLDIKGFGKHKIENYGEEILEILESI